MKVEEFNSGDTERQLVKGMITSRTVLARIAEQWTPDGLFGSRWANAVGGLAVAHYRKHGKAPRGGIESIFRDWAESHPGWDDVIRVTDHFLDAVLHQQDHNLNSGYLLDLAGRHFNRIRGRKLGEALLAADQANKPEKIVELLGGYREVNLGEEEVIDFFHDKAAHQSAFDDQQTAIVKYPGALGRFYGNALGREQFVTYVAPEKRGKSWVLIDLAYLAALQRCRTVFFEIGDLSRNQIMRRFQVRAAGVPRDAQEVRIPTRIRLRGDEPTVEWETKEFAKGLTLKTLGRKLRKTRREEIKSTEEYLKIVTAPAGTVTVASIKDRLQRWQRDGWVPDCVIVDYADLLAAPRGFTEPRDKINATWQEMRALSLSEHILLVTATQANRAAYNAHTLKMEHSSEDKRKLSHVTGCIGLNSIESEKRQGLIRKNWIVLREAPYLPSQCCYVAGCLALASPCMVSAMGRDKPVIQDRDDTNEDDQSPRRRK